MMELRWVEREVAIDNGLSRLEKALQYRWYEVVSKDASGTTTRESEWKDVPTVKD